MIAKLKRRAFNYLVKGMYDRRPTKESAFIKLNEMKVPVSAVIDVGVLESTPALISQYSNAHHILCEPVSEFKEGIHKAYTGSVSSYELVEAAIGDTTGEVTLEVSSAVLGQDITHSKVMDTPEVGALAQQRRVPLKTLDDIMGNREDEGPYLLKIDVDGRDLDVINGAKSTLKQCSVVCIEAGVKNIHQRLPAILAHDFQLFDIVDICYYEGRLIQVDLIFVKTSIIKDMGYNFFDGGFDITQWKAYLD